MKVVEQHQLHSEVVSATSSEVRQVDFPSITVGQDVSQVSGQSSSLQSFLKVQQNYFYLYCLHNAHTKSPGL